MTMPADRERDRRSLQDLAKMAHGLTPPPPSVAPSAPSGVQRAVEAKKDDSGIVDLAAASQADPSAALRAQSTPLASQGLFDEEPAHSQRPPMSAAPMSAPVSQAPHTAPLGAHGLPAQPAPSIPPVPASMPPASLPPQALTPSAPPVNFGAAAPVAASAISTGAQKKKGGGAVIALVIGGVVALSAAAAGGVFFMKSRNAVENTAATTVATAEPAATVAQAEPPPAKAETPAEPADTTPAPEPSTDPNALPTAAPHGKIAMAPRTAKGGAAKHEAPAAKPEGPAKMTEKDLAPTPTGPAGDLGAAIKKEVGDDGAPKTPAAATTGGNAPTGNVPTKPSQGAVTGAIGAVLPGARACLGPDDPVSRASVVFSSGGTVQAVNVSGHAAGKPTEACIKSALMKAKVAPFAEPTYTANITVRHN